MREAERAAAAGTGSVTGRALRVLEVFSPEAPVLTLTEISRRAGLPLTTAHRLVSELAGWGALERDPAGGYRIGLRLWEIAALAPRGLGLREVALPHLSDLARVTGENVQLAVREDLSVVYVERLAGCGSVPVLTRVGGRFALTPTGVGRVLLAHAPADVQERALAQRPVRYTERTECDPVRLRRLLAEVRRSGVAVCERQVTPDSVSVAAPVHGPGTGGVNGPYRTGSSGNAAGAGAEVVAAVSVVAHVETVPAHALVPLVQAAASGISRALGAPPAPVNGPAPRPRYADAGRSRSRTDRQVTQPSSFSNSPMSTGTGS
ncbi:IclR family transcriptional regulator [Streptomyces sp. Amel2xB2]|uniref:IclR family transcriptional regulator n=1 Tax=Streptomyces sp. Amel2xB2 TaxID=1305829 RepID=UPI000DBA7721|nr:IclR family transcriptional regulator [Streptomyces sp. Amel2xB2]RAJ59978.1 IclR family transcriptional regulator [Streptomyces sp. Amel2xB2]